MMRYVLLLFSFVILSYATIAQDEWAVVQNCIGELQYPLIERNNWGFDGVIVSSDYPKGVRGLRGDNNIDYIIAVESESTFTVSGVVSPDGQYFAYPTGSIDYKTGSYDDNVIEVEYIRIVRVDGQTQEKYRLSASEYAFILPYPTPLDFMWSPRWVGTNKIYFPSQEKENIITNFKTGKVELEIGSYFNFVSPDGTRAFTFNDDLYDVHNKLHILRYRHPRDVAWFLDSSAALLATVAYVPYDDTLIMINRDGEEIETISQNPVRDLAIAPDKHAFAFRDEEYNLYLADMNQKIVYDLCFQDAELSSLYHHPNLAWSPDSTELAFVHDRHIVIFDTTTFQNQVLNYQTRSIMGWYPLSGYDLPPAPTPPATLTPTPTSTSIFTPTSPATLTPTPTSTETLTPTIDNTVVGPTCELEVLVGTNLREKPDASSEQTGSAAIGVRFQANAQALNTDDYFRWWQLITGGWVREDMVREDSNCETLPEKSVE